MTVAIPAGAIDTHAHVFARGLPLAPGRRYTPDYDAAPEEYLGLLTDAGFTGGVLAQPSFLGADNEFLLSCLDRWPEDFRGIVVLHAGRTAVLDDLAGRGVVGARLNLLGQAVPDLGELRWQVVGTALARDGQHLEVQASGMQWLTLAPQLWHWPSPVVVDHFGLPGVDSRADQVVVNLASQEHVWVKVSAPYRSPVGAADAMLAALLEHCGPTRLVWGSDWPWTRHEAGRSYRHSLEWLNSRLDDVTFRKILADNPQRLLRWAPFPGRLAAPGASGSDRHVGRHAGDRAESSPRRTGEWSSHEDRW